MESNLDMSQLRSRNSPSNLPLAAAWGAGAFATIILFAAVLVVPVIRARSTLPAAPEIAEGRTTCGDHYNALIQQAKYYLMEGDRAAAIRLLRAAQAQLHICAVRTTQDVESSFPN
jgi:hypothetical protein